MSNNYAQNNETFLTNISFEDFPKSSFFPRLIDYFKELPKEYQMFMIAYSAVATTGIIYYAISNGYSIKTKCFSFIKPSANGE